MKKLSIIIPVFNCPDVYKALESAIKYKTDDIEIVVIDGKSTDGTYDILKKYENNIDILVSEPDKGIYDGFSKGVRKSTGSWVFVLAADDVLLVNPIRIIDKYGDSDVDLICGSMYEETKNGNYLVHDSDSNLQHLDLDGDIRHPSTFFRKNLYEKYGYYDLAYKCAADREFFMRLRANKVHFKFIDEKIVMFGYGGISTKNPIKYAFKEDFIISKKYGASDWTVKKDYFKKCVKYLVVKKMPRFLKEMIKKLVRTERNYISKEAVMDLQE